MMDRLQQQNDQQQQLDQQLQLLLQGRQGDPQCALPWNATRWP
jgi:hypothetical protein